MVYLSSVNNQNLNFARKVSFGKEENEQQKDEETRLLYREKKENPIKTTLQIEGTKLKDAFSTYPQKGFEGSKNANFYEFLTMGTVPYLVGSAGLIATFNLANRFFDLPAAENANKIGKKMGLGVVFYGAAKTLSKSFVEAPVNAKYGIDINVPYKNKINELPEERNVSNFHDEKREGVIEEQEEAQPLETDIEAENEEEQNKDKGNLVAYEYHKAFESVDFPRWDLFYDNKDFGETRNAYFDSVGKKMGLDDEDMEHSDQKVKPLIKEKIIQTRVFSTLSSYLWAAVGVGIAMQKPWEDFLIDPVKRFKDMKNGVNNPNFILDFGKTFVKSFKEFAGTDKNGPIDYIINKCKHQTPDTLKKPEAKHIAGRALLGLAAGTTLLGNFVTLRDVNKSKGSLASTSIIDESKEKVVC